MILTEKKDIGVIKLKTKQLSNSTELIISDVYLNDKLISKEQDYLIYDYYRGVKFPVILLTLEDTKKLFEMINKDFDNNTRATLSIQDPDNIVLINKEKERLLERYKENIKKKFLEKHKEKYQQAIETGKDVEILVYNDRCCDKKEACEIDIVKGFITPSGEYREERYHTW